MIYEQQALWNYPKQIYGPTGSHVKESALQESKKESARVPKMKKQMNAQTFFTKLLDCYKECPKKIDLSGCSVKMSEIFCLLTEVSECSECCVVWKKQGMTRNGKFSTLNTPTLSVKQLLMVSHRTGNVSTLSAILEETVDEKYFLSAEQTEKILANCKK